MDDQTVSATRPVHVGRQPIVDASGRVTGYELLFRADATDHTASSRGAYATSQVLVTACTEIGLDRLGDGRRVFVNVTREFLVGALPLPFEPDQAVLEILETVPVDDEVLAGVRDLVARGYAVALDDFVPGSPAQQLLEFATYIKVDVVGRDPADLAATVAGLRLRPDQCLLAEKVETPQDLVTAKALGFTLFQGYLFARPQVVSGQRLTPSRVRTLRLLTVLADPRAPMRRITAELRTDPALAYRLLTAANSASSAICGPITSIHQAAVFVGADRVRQWLTLMTIADLAGDEHHATAVLVQARFCQEIAVRRGLPAAAAYTVGLLDAVCELTGDGRTTFTRQVPLAPDLATAVTRREGPLGRVLAAADAYRQRRTTALDGSPDLASAYLAALAWASDVAQATAQP